MLHRPVLVKVLRKKWKLKHLQFIDNWETPSADEDPVTQSKAPEQLLSGLLGNDSMT